MAKKKGRAQRPGVGLAVILMNRGKVLLGKRKNTHGEGAWSFPGGHLEYFESFDSCVIRELKEETGLENDLNYELDANNPVAVTNDFFPESQKHYVTLFMRAKYKSGIVNLMEPDKCEEWKWYKLGNLPKPLFISVENLIKQGYNLFYG